MSKFIGLHQDVEFQDATGLMAGLAASIGQPACGMNGYEESDDLSCICTKCKQVFKLVAEGEGAGFTNIQIRSCDSGGIYAVYIECPHCKHRHNLG